MSVEETQPTYIESDVIDLIQEMRTLIVKEGLSTGLVLSAFTIMEIRHLTNNIIWGIKEFAEILEDRKYR